ncbi:hypothetical protein [Deinococcus yavapaiensis]|nr:hypothetical protein [Deinococcus yavapaiensis]
MVLESSAEEFTTRYAAHAAQGVLYPGVEGSPLLEFEAGGVVLYLFDRSGPYAALPGPARMVVHAVAKVLEVVGSGEESESLTTTGISSVEGVGYVVQVSRNVCVVQARVPLVLGSFTALSQLSVGDWVRFDSEAPLHGFLIS